MQRRWYIVASLVIAATAVVLVTLWQQMKPATMPEAHTTAPQSTTAATTSLAERAAKMASCGIAPQSGNGPYYLSGTALLTDNNLNYKNLPGTEVTVGGYVYNSNTQPIADATIELWQADGAGNYHPAAQGAATDFLGNEIALRGAVKSNAYGFYVFSSILPAVYEGRVRHIHAKISAAGYETTTTQIIMYQSGDAITPEQDFVTKNYPDCAKPSFYTDDNQLRGTYNFVLAKTR